MTLALGCGAHAPCEPCAGDPAASAQPTSSAPAPEGVGSDDGAGPRVAVGTCDVGWLPPEVVIETTPEDTEALAAALRTWLGAGAVRDLRIDLRRGIVHAKSEDDLGADPPYPTRTGAQSTLACGVESEWLADHVRATFARQASPDFGGVACQGNVCCFSGMEYMSSGMLVARRETIDGATRWVLDAYVEVADAALGPEAIAANRAYVADALLRERRGTCPGEPAGLR